MSDAQVTTYEALCSALYQMPFAEFLGETDAPVPGLDDRGRTAWFHLGEPPKDVRVSICLEDKAERVSMKIEWLNLTGHSPLKGEQTLRISTYAATKAQLEPAAEAAVLRVLEVYQEVLAGVGVAGKLSELAPDAEDSDEDVPGE